MNNKFEHTLSVQDIIVRQDNTIKNNWIESVSGQIYPLVRIKEQVLEFPDIVSFRLTTGWDTLLPTLDITIDDSEMIFTESNYMERGDILTIYVGNPNDPNHKPIKNDYYVTSVENVVGSKNVTITSQLHVPKLFAYNNRVWANTTSLKIMEELAKECGLGFTTNISETSDAMNWIQSGSNVLTLIEITDKSFVSGDTFVITYIDQWANLNYIDVKNVLDTKGNVQLTTVPISGEVLKTPMNLYLTNTHKDGGGGDLDNPQPVPKIVDYAPSYNYGMASGRYVNKVLVDVFDLVDKSEMEAEQVEMKPQLLEKSTLTTFEFGNIHENYSICKATNINSRQLLQGLNISVLMDYYIPVLYNGLNVPLEIYNSVKTERNFSQDENVGNDEIGEIESTNGGESMTMKLNPMFSGDVVVTTMAIAYNKGSRVGSTNRIQQTLTLFKKDK